MSATPLACVPAECRLMTAHPALLHRMALCRELGYEQFITMGHSIGGFWCQQIAAGLPDNCRGAIMFSVRTGFIALQHSQARGPKTYTQPPYRTLYTRSP